MRVTIVHNPTAGEDGHSAQGLCELIQKAGHDVSYFSSKEEDWKRALGDAGDLVAVAGGDGTVAKVFCRLAGGVVPAAVLPLGSANNVARTLGIAEVDVVELVAQWSHPRRQRFDIGHVGAECFVESVGGGLFADSLERAEEHDDEGSDKVALGLSRLHETLARLRVQRWRVELDGNDHSGEFIAVEAMLVRETGPNIPLAPAADPADGRLDVVCVPEDARPALASYLAARLQSASAEAPNFPVVQCREAVIGPPPGAFLRVDDDVWDAPSDPVVAECGSGSVELLMPAGEQPTLRSA